MKRERKPTEIGAKGRREGLRQWLHSGLRSGSISSHPYTKIPRKQTALLLLDFSELHESKRAQERCLSGVISEKSWVVVQEIGRGMRPLYRVRKPPKGSENRILKDRYAIKNILYRYLIGLTEICIGFWLRA